VQELFVCAVDDNSLIWYKRFRLGERGVGHFSSAYIPAAQTIIPGGTIYWISLSVDGKLYAQKFVRM
ncbi:MAG: hypothetical protein KDD15_25450, partial [Lewinella sp.]|nr:hypothetical protein [Lewinella sp.]